MTWVQFPSKEKGFRLPYFSNRRWGFKTSCAVDTGGFSQKFKAAGALR